MSLARQSVLFQTAVAEDESTHNDDDNDNSNNNAEDTDVSVVNDNVEDVQQMVYQLGVARREKEELKEKLKELEDARKNDRKKHQLEVQKLNTAVSEFIDEVNVHKVTEKEKDELERTIRDLEKLIQLERRHHDEELLKLKCAASDLEKKVSDVEMEGEQRVSKIRQEMTGLLITAKSDHNEALETLKDTYISRIESMQRNMKRLEQDVEVLEEETKSVRNLLKMTFKVLRERTARKLWRRNDNSHDKKQQNVKKSNPSKESTAESQVTSSSSVKEEPAVAA